MIYACNEHVDIAIDDIIDLKETFPEISECLDDEKCSFCEKKAIYILTDEH